MKKWRIANHRSTASYYLLMRRISFGFSEDGGLVFEAAAPAAEEIKREIEEKLTHDRVDIEEVTETTLKTQI